MKTGTELKYDEEDEELSAVYQIKSESDLDELIGWIDITIPTLITFVKVFSYKNNNNGKEEEIFDNARDQVKKLSEAEKQEILSKLPKKMHEYAKGILYPN